MVAEAPPLPSDDLPPPKFLRPSCSGSSFKPSAQFIRSLVPHGLPMCIGHHQSVRSSIRPMCGHGEADLVPSLSYVLCGCEQFPELYSWPVLMQILTQVIAGTIVTRSPNSTMAPNAMKDLDVAVQLFEQAAEQSHRAKVALVGPIFLLCRRHVSWTHFRPFLNVCKKKLIAASKMLTRTSSHRWMSLPHPRLTLLRTMSGQRVHLLCHRPFNQRKRTMS
jgi:hypothetical protein